MKFLSKYPQSDIVRDGLKYVKNRAKNNALLLQRLLAEQKNFCAYTEKYIDGLDSVEVEHFNSALKYNDDYFNYYAVVRKSNLYKKDELFRNASFFDSLFFQNPENLRDRVMYITGEYIYEEANPDDSEARDFIDFLGLNNNVLFEERRKHMARLSYIFTEAGYSNEEKLDFFRRDKDMLKFITAIERELEIDLSEFYQ